MTYQVEKPLSKFAFQVRNLRRYNPEGRMWERLRLAINQPVFSPKTKE